MGLSAENRSSLFAFSTAVAVIDGVVGGAAAALAAGYLLDFSLALATALGAATALASIIAWLRYAARLLERAAEVEPLFPTPAAARGRDD
jgi:hypothetical protein